MLTAEISHNAGLHKFIMTHLTVAQPGLTTAFYAVCAAFSSGILHKWVIKL